MLIKYDNKIFNTYVWYSNAKINLFLIIGPYVKDKKLHKIYSLFIPIDLFDTFYVEKSDFFNIIYYSSSGEKISVENCIIEKINKLLNIKPKLSIKIIKNIPIGGGLGGASSNAFTYLKILNYFSYINMKKLKNKNFLLKIGSDVPFFLFNRPAIISRFGDKIKIIKNFPLKYYFIILNNNIFSRTSLMYNELDKERANLNENKIKEIFLKNIKNQKKILKNLIKYDYRYVKELYNDFETIFLKLFNITLEHYSLDVKGVLKSILSGSGSSFINIIKSPDIEIDTLENIDKRNNVFKVKIFTKY
ncbi:MAG: hypothetical protein N3A58_05155 [Spirochaetes bacterium]|nr:hypothetical protein [Spirochaetota bacterium]